MFVIYFNSIVIISHTRSQIKIIFENSLALLENLKTAIINQKLWKLGEFGGVTPPSSTLFLLKMYWYFEMKINKYKILLNKCFAKK